MAIHRLIDLAKRAVQASASEMKLIPGRRVIVVLPHGTSEVRGEVLAPERIQELMGQVITASAERALAFGWAEWDFPLEGQGMVHACAELKLGVPHFTLFLDGCLNEAEAEEPEPPTMPEIPKPGNLPPFKPMDPEVGAMTPGIRERRDPRPGLKTSPPLPPSEQMFAAAPVGGSTAELDKLLSTMVETKASDLHVSSGVAPMLRVDGEMVKVPGYSALGPEQLQRLVMPIVPPRNRQEFADTHDTDFAYDLPGKGRFRANIFVDLHGMGGVFRVIPSKILTVEDLKLPVELLTLCDLPKGLVLVTGPTGSGKSTTLAALIDYINRTRNAHIITIEDPIEFVHPNKKCLINQRQVGEHTDSFKKALRAALREDPDIVLLGEMRDLETIAIALETAETGHLVFGTLHTSSAPATIDRIIDQYPPEQQNQIRVMLSSSLRGVICQMLCKKKGGGRVAALEVMLSVPAISNLIREGKVFQIPSTMQTGRKLGMCLLNDNLLRLVREGQVTPEEALSKSNDKATLQLLFQQSQIELSPSPL